MKKLKFGFAFAPLLFLATAVVNCSDSEKQGGGGGKSGSGGAGGLAAGGAAEGGNGGASPGGAGGSAQGGVGGASEGAAGGAAAGGMGGATEGGAGGSATGGMGGTTMTITFVKSGPKSTYEDIKPILMKGCADCHTQKLTGGFKVSEFITIGTDAIKCPGRVRGECIVILAKKKEMPPRCGAVNQPPCLKDDDIKKLENWVAWGMLEK